jgi:hypothetical protein
MDQREDGRRGSGGRDEGATFDPEPITRRGGRPILAAMVALSVGGLVVLGAAERLASPSTAEAPFAAVDESAALASPAPPVALVPAPNGATLVSRTSGDIKVYARRYEASTYLHGEVYVRDAAWVYVSVRDTPGQVAGWASLGVPDAATPSAPASRQAPRLQFDIEIAVPGSFANGSLWVQANAYDGLGRIVDFTRFEILADGEPGAGASASPAGFNPRPPPAHGPTRPWTRFDE